jgi:hypothetical protein
MCLTARRFSLTALAVAILGRARVLFLASLCVIGVGPTARATVIVTQVGAPTFVPTDFHLFAAPIGTAATGYAEFLQTLQLILPPPNHVFNPIVSIGPGDPHPGPYDQEIGKGVATNGFVDSTTFPAADYSNGTGVFLAFMIVPGPGSPTGSSPDFTSGPIIPNAIFPLMFAAGTFTNGTFNDISASPFQVPAVDQIDERFVGLDGYSHVPFFLGDNFDFATQEFITGNYEYRISLLDAAGDGYQIVVPFSVVPEPSTWVMLLAGFAGLGFAGFCRAMASHATRLPSSSSQPPRRTAGGEGRSLRSAVVHSVVPAAMPQAVTVTITRLGF